MNASKPITAFDSLFIIVSFLIIFFLYDHGIIILSTKSIKIDNYNLIFMGNFRLIFIYSKANQII